MGAGLDFDAITAAIDAGLALLETVIETGPPVIRE